MAARETSAQELAEVRERLIREVHERLGDKEIVKKHFLQSFRRIDQEEHQHFPAWIAKPSAT